MSEQLLKMQEVLKNSLLKIKKLEAELEEARQQPAAVADEPIAIVGLGCRFPGGIRSLESLWQLLMDKKDAAVEIPLDRWDNSLIYDPDPLTPGKTHATKAAFLEEDVKAFDADFFGIVPREAKSIDPLQRMILEVVYEALEEANIPSDTLKGSNTAVYIALGNSDYIQARFRSGNLATMDVYDATGIPFATAAGRVSYLYDLQGPNFALDAACASSIVGLHLAAESLRKGESDVAIVASANLLLTPELFVGLSKLGSLSAEGKCKAFAEDADGYVRGEGCGVAVLKRKSDALQNGNHLHALILGSAVKHDGLSNGFTAPNPKVQLDTVQEAIAKAKVNVEDISFVEAHGIGNKFTDAMEIQAIGKGYKGRKDTLYVGSLKPNIGHLEACIGMAMLFKVIGTLKNKTIAPNLYIEHPNTDIPWDALKVKVPSDAVVLENSQKPLRAAINLSGYSGTNVHMIFEEAPAVSLPSAPEKEAYILVWSAAGKDALKALVRKYLDNGILHQTSLATLAYTLQTGRNQLAERLSVTASDVVALEKSLQNFLDDVNDSAVVAGNTEQSAGTETAFLFTGQGAQYKGMCRYYYENEPVFKKAVDDCAAIIDPLLAVPIKDILWNNDTDAALIDQTAYTQPALFVVEYALAKWWMSLGIKPAALAGHSVGEFVALCIAEAISLKDALQLIVKRAALMQSLPLNAGAMLAVLSDEATVAAYLPSYEGQIAIAAVNTPAMVTVSGAQDAIQQLSETLKEAKIKSIAVQVSHAFHSPLMEPILKDFEAAAAAVTFSEPVLPVVSNVTGKILSLEDLTPAYFSQHLRGTVRFADDIQTLYKDLNIRVFLECGPQPTLSAFGPKTISDKEVRWLFSAKKDSSDVRSALSAQQGLFVAGVKFSWSALYSQSYQKCALPTYTWQRKVYWENPVRGLSANISTSASIPVPQGNTASKKPKVSKENLMAIMQLEGADTLGLEPGQKVDPAKPLREQGFDSMMSGEFLSRMEKYFDTQLEMSLIHTYGTLNDLQRHFIDTYLGGGDVAEGEAVTMGDIVFGSDLGGSSATTVKNWHEIKPDDPLWLRVFKKIDKHISIDG